MQRCGNLVPVDLRRPFARKLACCRTFLLRLSKLLQQQLPTQFCRPDSYTIAFRNTCLAVRLEQARFDRMERLLQTYRYVFHKPKDLDFMEDWRRQFHFGVTIFTSLALGGSAHKIADPSGCCGKVGKVTRHFRSMNDWSVSKSVPGRSWCFNRRHSLRCEYEGSNYIKPTIFEPNFESTPTIDLGIFFVFFRLNHGYCISSLVISIYYIHIYVFLRPRGMKSHPPCFTSLGVLVHVSLYTYIYICISNIHIYHIILSNVIYIYICWI